MFASLMFLSAAVTMDSHLPPLKPWQGESVTLMQEKGPLTTDFELSGGMRSPNYEDTMAFVDRLVAANPTQFKVQTIATSSAGRKIKMLVANEQGLFDAAQLTSDAKPTIFIQAGIHSGEIDGKDAMFMLLRDIATGKRRDILSKVNILFIPILNVDGHERSSQFNRINQRGPVEMGFRTNGLNLNLNRDYTKLDTPEVRGVLKVINTFKPDLYVDVHVTDGADYQYDVTYGYNPVFSSESPSVSEALDTMFKPIIDAKLTKMGHIPGPLVFVMDKRDFKKGLAGWVATPRYSNGWGDLRSLPSILVENHSLKPYKQRVLGTYVFLDGAIDALAKNNQALQAAVKKEREFKPTQLVVERSYATELDTLVFKGIKYTRSKSELSGQAEVAYLGEEESYDALPIYWQKIVKKTVNVPSAFYIPPAYSAIISKLKLHGVEVLRVNDTGPKSLTQASVKDYTFANVPFEGRFRVEASFDYKSINDVDVAGWYKVSTNQPYSELATHLLHPEAPDSFFAWGEFNTIFQRTEYMENYALIPYAKQMLQEQPELALEFDQKVREDKAFAKDPEARLNWLYKRSPFYDQAYLQYPILMAFEQPSMEQ
ncbi:M14 family metallopeptidase [Pseudoalteromonas sp. N1230-9]|uniref:M14 family metallopeptidase n=1 Tax=Pseudoalteromonas sp. N1230-9 TaxID=2907156 RepID=UPI002B2DDFF4|nr:M14 family metallopeptidase [Pseudoalteromonas sp. N1230-9]